MSLDGPITQWISQLKAGDPLAAQHLWESYFGRLMALARKKLGGNRRAAADEEDVALSAFGSFCRGAGVGRFPLLHDRDNLWPLLVRITERKAIDQLRHEGRAKRGRGKVRGESGLEALGGSSSSEAGLARVSGRDRLPPSRLR
jgi:DNA-directed RNA polymerase specialized sigma24 family protein